MSALSLSPIERHHAARDLTQSLPWRDYLRPHLESAIATRETLIMNSGPQKCRDIRTERALLLKILSDVHADARPPQPETTEP